MSAYGYALIGKTWIELEVDPDDVTHAQIKQLKDQIVKERVKCDEKIDELEVTINSMLSIENGLNEGDM
jgi:hypothetical protein